MKMKATLRKKTGPIAMFLLAMILVGCINEKKEGNINSISNTPESNNHGTVKPTVLIGISDEQELFRVFNALDDSYLFSANHKNANKRVAKDTMILDLNINSARLMEIAAYGPDENFYETKFYIVPGDTIRFKMRDGKVYSIEKGDPENNFYQYMNDSTPSYAKNKYSGDIKEYGIKTKEIYGEKLRFLETYISREKFKSPEAIAAIRMDLKFEYYNNLIQPRSLPSYNREFYYNEMDGLLPILQKESGVSESIFDYREYFGNISLDDFTASSETLNPHFKNSINPFIRYYFLSSENLPYTKENFLAEKDFIEKKLTGRVKRYAIARMISDYHNKGFGLGKNTIQIIKDAISEYEPKFKEDSYILRMNEIRAELNNFDFALPNEVLGTRLLNKLGDTISLRDILMESSSKIKILDLWTSWCPPCIRDIRETTELKMKLAQDKNVQWIYLSMDEKIGNWKKSSENLENELASYPNYWVITNFNSDFAEFFKIKSIPRYIILNQDNKIVVDNAPSPFLQEDFERLINNVLE